ncbi:hypothetical protein IID26_02775 [Patescibacteria group bacterium]|nr:hypothetical protein [Patescibacteria group bacterium]
MLNFLRKYKSFLILLSILIFSLFLYQFFTADNRSGLLLTGGVPSGLDGKVVGREIVEQLAQLQEINFGQDLFSDPKFIALVSFIANIREEPSGRNNPFAPIGSDGVYIPKVEEITPYDAEETFFDFGEESGSDEEFVDDEESFNDGDFLDAQGLF